MIISQTLHDKLEANLRASPLGANEVRRVVGAGELYFALPDTETGSEFDYLYSLKIGGVLYRFYAKIVDE